MIEPVQYQTFERMFGFIFMNIIMNKDLFELIQ